MATQTILGKVNTSGEGRKNTKKGSSNDENGVEIEHQDINRIWNMHNGHEDQGWMKLEMMKTRNPKSKHKLSETLEIFPKF